MLRTLIPLRSTEVSLSYLDAIISGVARHLKYRFGNLSSSSTWDPIKPLPDGKRLALELLSLVERFGYDWIKEDTMCDAVEACAWVLDDNVSAERLTLTLYRLQRSSSPEPPREDTSASSDGLNTTRGKAAGSTMILANRLVEAGHELPELLPPLLQRFATDPVEGVRWAVLRHLPVLAYYRPDFGWTLADLALADASSELWQESERLFYHNYLHHFSRVDPFLRRIAIDGYGKAGETYGRIMALAALADHLEMSELIASIPVSQSEVWIGIAQVLCTNIAAVSMRTTCIDGLLNLLTRDNPPKEVFKEVDSHLDRDVGRFIPTKVIELLIMFEYQEAGRLSFPRNIAPWIRDRAMHDPEAALQVLNLLADKLEEESMTYFPHAEDLVQSLHLVLREADESDDSQFIRNVITTQDCYLRIGIRGLEEMLDAASRP